MFCMYVSKKMTFFFFLSKKDLNVIKFQKVCKEGKTLQSGVEKELHFEFEH